MMLFFLSLMVLPFLFGVSNFIKWNKYNSHQLNFIILLLSYPAFLLCPTLHRGETFDRVKAQLKAVWKYKIMQSNNMLSYRNKGKTYEGKKKYPTVC